MGWGQDKQGSNILCTQCQWVWGEDRRGRDYGKVQSPVRKADCCIQEWGKLLCNQSFWFLKRNQRVLFCVSMKTPNYLNVVSYYFATLKPGGGHPWKAKQNMSEGQIWPRGALLWLLIYTRTPLFLCSQLLLGSLLKTSLTAAEPDASWQCKDLPQSTSCTFTCGHCK